MIKDNYNHWLTTISVGLLMFMAGALFGPVIYSFDIGAIALLLMTFPALGMAAYIIGFGSSITRLVAVNCFGFGEIVGLMTAAMQWHVNYFGVTGEPFPIIGDIVLAVVMLVVVNSSYYLLYAIAKAIASKDSGKKESVG